jgi:hypothetical protein
MLSIDLSVNGRQIMHVAAINKGPSGDGETDSYFFKVVADDSFSPASRDSGFVQHRRAEGARELVMRIFEAIA